jgi:broad specificity phosphatase PhoE
MKRILLVRHGQTDWNAAGRWQGHEDIPLNATGLEQARALAEHLRDCPISAVYSSDLKRAQMTAAVIAEAHGLTLKLDPRWRELHLGVFQGLTTNEINAKYPTEARRMREDYMGYVIPTGEARRAMQARAFAAYQQILREEPGDEIVVVSHGGTIRVVLLKLFGDDVLHRSIHNTSISTIETDGNTAKLIDTGLTPHLNE